MNESANARVERRTVSAVAVPAAVGFAAVVGQVVLLREAIAIFNGNEISIGVFLGVWLAWTAAGSAAMSRLIQDKRNVRGWIAACASVCGASLPATVWMLREARVYLQTTPGELLGPVAMTLTMVLCLSIFCLLAGCMFALAARWFCIAGAGTVHTAVSLAYLLETVGSAAGGIAASLVLLRVLGPFQMALVAAMLLMCVGLGVALQGRMRAAALGGVVICGAALMVVAPRMEKLTESRMWSGFDVLAVTDSIYGRLAVLNANGMRTIYADGEVAANVPDPAAAEETAHYALLEHAAPRRILMMGGGMNGSIAEVLKHRTVERLDYVELDPAMIAMYRSQFAQEWRRQFGDSRVHVHLGDGRLYLKSVQDRYDVVMVHAPDPLNAQWNRFYTVEFFREAKARLAVGGVMAMELHAAEEAIGPELREYLSTMLRTFGEVFPQVAVIPGETMHVFGAMEPGVLSEDPGVLAARLNERGIETQYVRPLAIRYRMMPDRMAQAHELMPGTSAAPVNRDFKPVAYSLGAAVWNAQFNKGYARLLASVERRGVATPLMSAGAAMLALMLVWLAAPRARSRLTAGWAMMATGFAMMALQILVLLAFQAVCGFVYAELAILIGMFMAGMALGSWRGRMRAERKDARLTALAAWNQVLLAIAAPLLLLIGSALSWVSGGESLILLRLGFPVLALLCGIPGGYAFPLMTAMAERGAAKQGTGMFYALDLAGGCLGALVLAGIVIPVFGFWNTAWLTAVVNAGPALVLGVSGFMGEAGRRPS